MSEAPAQSSVQQGNAPDDRPVPWWRRLVAASLLPLGLVLLWVAGEFPEFVEEHYSASLFPRVRGGLRSLSALAPLPLGQTFLLLIVAGAALRSVGGVLRVLAGRRSLRNLLAHGVSRVLRGAGLLYAFFLLSWGFNHARAPYAQHAGLSLDAVQTADLDGLLVDLTERCNSLRAQFEDGDLALRAGSGGVDARIAAGYARLATRIPALRSGKPILRRAFLSPALSALGISGIYSPFTAEAHINEQIVPWLQPFVSAHEIAHFKGFAREDEANFIAWQVCENSQDPAVRYSGNLVALIHVASSLASVDAERAQEQLANLTESVLADVDQNRAFWASKRSQMTAVALATNDAYLKSQGQEAGRASYGRMVDLLVAYRDSERKD